MKKLNILVVFDSAGTPPTDQDFTEEFKTEEWFAEAGVVETLTKLGHNVRTLGIYDDIDLLAKELVENRPDIVFNLTEIFLGKASLDKNIPALFELFEVPYTGCGPIGLMICNNKAVTKKILSYHRIKVPKFHIFHKGKRIWHPKALKFPLMVKPLQEEASTGIAQASFVEKETDLKERVQYIHDRFNMPALTEEYIDGRELYVSIMGKRRLRAFPLREMKFQEVPDDEPKMATYKAKWDKKYRRKWGIKNEFADRLPNGLPEKIIKTCKKAYRALEIDGYARFDLRVTATGEVFIIEANANPEIAQKDEFAESAIKAGFCYETLVQKIIQQGLQRDEKTGDKPGEIC